MTKANNSNSRQDLEIEKLKAEIYNLKKESDRNKLRVWVPALATFFSIIVTGIIYFLSNSYEAKSGLAQIEKFKADTSKIAVSKEIDILNKQKDSINRLIIQDNFHFKVIQDSIEKLKKDILSLKQTIKDQKTFLNDGGLLLFKLRQDSIKTHALEKQASVQLGEETTTNAMAQQKNIELSENILQIKSQTSDYITKVGQLTWQIRVNKDTSGLQWIQHEGEFLINFMKKF